MCGRELDGLPPCWKAMPGRPDQWCRYCRVRYAEAHDAGRPLDYEAPPAPDPDDDGPAGTEDHHWELGPDLDDAAAQAAWDQQFEEEPLPPVVPPCPLESHQAEAWADWLALGDRPAWSLEQVSRPSPN